MLAAQIGMGGGSEQTARDLAIMILLMMLLELLEGRQSEGQLQLGALGGGGQNSTLLLTSASMSTSVGSIPVG